MSVNFSNYIRTKMITDYSDKAQVINDIISLNPLIKQASTLSYSFPDTKIDKNKLRFEETNPVYYDYCNILLTPPTPTGKLPKYIASLYFYTKPMGVDQTSNDIFGDLHYLQTGDIGKARIIRWYKHDCFMLHIAIKNNALCVNKIEALDTYGNKRDLYKRWECKSNCVNSISPQ
jgi:hypothetical protein